MSAFDWRSEYSVNIDAMDEQHKELVGMINRLDASIKQGNGKAALTEALDQLMNYVKTHFAEEEKLMKENKYPDYESHRQAHIDMTIKAAQLKSRNIDYRPAAVIETLEFLVHWFMTHIQGVDKRYGAYLNERQVY